MSYEVKIMDYEDLPEEQKKDQPDNGCGKEYANYLGIYLDGVLLAVYSDAMEPEDVRFCRDLSWITTELERAFELGKQA